MLSEGGRRRRLQPHTSFPPSPSPNPMNFIRRRLEVASGLGGWFGSPEAIFGWRGQGGSDRLLKRPLRGHVRRFSDFEDDLSTFLETIVLPEPRLPSLGE